MKMAERVVRIAERVVYAVGAYVVAAILTRSAVAIAVATVGAFALTVYVQRRRDRGRVEGEEEDSA